MGKIARWDNIKKIRRSNTIGDYIPCPICLKPDGLHTWEGERALVCRYCGAKYQKKQKYIKSRDKERNT